MAYTIIASRKDDTEGVFQFVTRSGFLTDEPERAVAFSFRVDAEEFRKESEAKGSKFEFRLMQMLF